jgi:peptidoglycan/LPS O-acetylase OafA/YrhL
MLKYQEYVPLGLLRLFLSVSVMATHLWETVAPDAGRHAVMCFFVISGFLVTKIANEHYTNRPRAFLLNRFLRLYPLYAVAALAGALTLLILPHRAFDLSGSFEWPMNLQQWLAQLFIIGLNDTVIRFSPSAWSLAIEIYFYLLIGLLTYRSARLTYAAFVLSLVPAVLTLLRIVDMPFYMGSYGSAFAFFAGASLYFLNARLQLSPLLFHAGLALLMLNMFGTPLLLSEPLARDAALGVSVFLMAPILLASRHMYASLKGISSWAGKFAYPLFLLHWAVAVYLTIFFEKDSAGLFLGTLLACLFVSYALIISVEDPIEKIREKLRKSAINYT